MWVNFHAHWRLKLPMKDRPNLLGMIRGPSFVRNDADDEVIDLTLNDLKLVTTANFTNPNVDSH